MAIQITDAALNGIKRRMELSDNLKRGIAAGTTFLRMGIRGGGCCGFSYLLELDNQLRLGDKVFECAFPGSPEGEPKLKVAVDAKSYLYLNGATLDYVTEGLSGGFVFRNPNAKSGCGCGRSFSG